MYYDKKFTPGPWEHSNNAVWTYLLDENSEQGNTICIGCQSGEMNEANLRLIAAAPELFKCVEELLSVIHGPLTQMAPSVDNALRLITKIRSES